MTLYTISKLREKATVHLRAIFASVPWTVLVATALPYALAISLIISVGGTLQYAVAKLLSGDAPTLYGAVYDNGINLKLTLGTWLRFGFTWPWLAVGSVTAIVALRQRLLGRVILTTCWLLPLGLTATDIIQGLADGSTLSDHSVNLVANFIGGPVAAVLAAPALLLLLFIPRWVRSPGVLGTGVAAIAAVAWGAAVCAFAFLGYSFLFVPVSQRIELVLAPPIKGMSFAPVSFEQPKPKNKFSFLPKGGVDATASITAPRGKLSAHWESLHGEHYKVSIQVLLDCVSQDIAKLPAGAPALVRTGLGSVWTTVSEGHAELKLAGGRTRYTYAPTMPASYWIDLLDKDKVKISHFVSAEDPIDAEITTDAALLISNAGMRYRDGLGYPVPRTLSVRLGSEQITFKFSKPSFSNSSQPLRCRTVMPVKVGNNGEFIINDHSMYGAILLRFTANASKTVYSTYDANLHITGANGWFGVNNIPIDQLGEDVLGTTGFLTSEGSAELFRLDGADTEITEHDTLTSVGELRPQYTADGKVRVTGVANQIWRGEQRLSPTKWERLPLEVKLTLLTLLMSIGGLFEFGRRIVRRYAGDDVADPRASTTM